MIRRDQLVEIGSFFKPHGIKGEISAGFNYEFDIDCLRCIIVDIDGIFVPFFISSWRMRGPGRFLLKLDGIDDESTAAPLVNQTIYAVANELPPTLDEENIEDGIYLHQLVGFKLIRNNNTIGTINLVDDSTSNVLLHIETPQGKTVLVPFTEDWIEQLDPHNRRLVMDIPDELLTLNN